MEFFNSLGQVLTNAKNYPAWQQQEQQKKLKQEQLLAKNPPTKKQTAEAKEYSRVMVDAINTMDMYSINKSEDVVTLTTPVVNIVDGLLPYAVLLLTLGAASLPSVQKGAASTANKLKNWLIELKSIKTKPDLVQNINNALDEKNGTTLVLFLSGAIVQIVLGFALALVDAIAVRGLEKEASRVARFQAREQVLQDPRNFVNYTPEQLAEAKAEAKESKAKDPNKPKSLNPLIMLGESIKTAKELTEQHKGYESWKANFIAKETTALNQLDLDTLSDQEKQDALVDQNRITAIIKTIELKSQQYLANVEMVVNIASSLSLGAGLLVGGLVEKGIEVAQHQKWLPIDIESSGLSLIKKGVTFAFPILGGILVSIYGIKIQKEAAKVGRFKAKQELLKHPELFVASVNGQKKEEVASLPPLPPLKKKSFIESVKEEVRFFFNLNKDFDAYKAHEKELAPKEYQLNEALKQVDITPEQLHKAEVLQKRAFYAFEKMDEKTQRYSDDVEGGASVVTAVINKVMEQVLTCGAFMLPIIMVKANENAKNIKTTGNEVENIAHSIPSGIKVIGSLLLLTLPVSLSTIWAAQMKKTAAQVGVMLSMKELEDPKRMLVAPSLPLVSPSKATNKEAEDDDDTTQTTENVA